MAHKLPDSVTFSPEEAMQEDLFITLISNSIENRKIIILTIKWYGGSTEVFRFEPYLLGNDPNYQGLFVHGKNLDFGYDSTYDRSHTTAIELTNESYPQRDMVLGYYSSSETILKSLPELKMLQGAPDLNPIVFDETDENSLLLKQTILNHPRFWVIPYNFEDDSELAKDFDRIKRKKWTKEYFTLIGEWSESPMYSGDFQFYIKSTSNKKHWALFQIGDPTRIYFVAEVIEKGTVVMERIVAKMMSMYTENEGLYIECYDVSGEVNLKLLYTLYDYYNQLNKNEHDHFRNRRKIHQLPDNA